MSSPVGSANGFGNGISCDLPQYYAYRSIHARMAEFLGGPNVRRATAVYIIPSDGRSPFGDPFPPDTLPRWLEAGLEIDRSLWDRESLVADIDLEYENFDCPCAAWSDPERAFRLEAPVFETALALLRENGIDPLVLVSGRGFHLVWSVSRGSRAFGRLARMGTLPPTLNAWYAHPLPPAGKRLDIRLGCAFEGLGLVMEFFGHRLLQALPHSPISIQLTSIEVGPGAAGREIVCFDISEYGDPLHTRHIRLPFSAYLKPRRFEWALGEEGLRELPPIFEIPLSGMALPAAIETARDPDKTIALSRTAATYIPERSMGMEQLIEKYEHSELARFHREFYAESSTTPPLSNDPAAIRIPDAPRCLEWLLEHPNDWLLKPAMLQHTARVLTSLGWRPWAIVRLIYGSYLRDCQWGDRWVRLDPLKRAIFYTRLFTGMIATGVDRLIDFNCVSHQEKGYCMTPYCGANLLAYRDLLCNRRDS